MEEVRFLVQEEGRAARNLIAFNVPVEHAIADNTGKALTRKPPTSPRSQNEVKKDDVTRNTKRSCESPKAGSRVRSASTGRDKKSELQARYWAFLFGNLQRAVDEIYQTCETDESVSECKEVILVLENYTRDFHNLIEWFKLKWEYENTPPPQRPNSLAWEIRKSSPGKVRHNVSSSVPEKVPAIAVTDIERELILKAQQQDSSETAKNEKKLLAATAKMAAAAECDDKVEASVISKKTADSPASTATSLDVTAATEVVTSVSDVAVKKQECSNGTVENNVGVTKSEIENTTCPETGDTDISVPVESENTPDSATASRKQVDAVEDVSSLPQETNVVKTIDVNGTGDSICENVLTATDRGQNEPLQSETGKLSNCSENSEKKDVVSEGKTEAQEEAVQMVHQASQTDLEQCVEDSEGLRFLSVPQKLPTTTSTQVIKSAPVTVSRTPTAPVKSPVIPPRTGVRTPSMAASVKQQQPSSVRPAYAAVSRAGNPTLPRTQPATQTRPYSSPRLVRSRTSTDVRPVSRATLLRKPESSPGVVKPQRSTLVARQPRPVGQSNLLMLASAAPKVESIPETGPAMDRRSGSNSSLNSSASSGARSWADKVKGSENSRTTVSVEVLPRTGAGNEDDDTQGWETVKSRSRSRISPANKVDGLSSPLSRSAGNIKYQALERKGSVSTAPRAYAIKKRFQQPSAATSLPALALIEVEVKPPIDNKKLAVKKTGAPARIPAYRNNTNIAKMKREIKDIKEDNKKSSKESRTSLQAKKNEENKRASNLVKEKTNSSVDLKAEVVSFENKDTDNIKTKLISKEDFQREDKEESSTHDDHKDSEETNSKTGNITLDEQFEDILEEKSLFNEEELRKSKELSAEEEMLRKEIHELEATEIEVDTETDETETDGEATIGPEDEEEERQHIISENQKKLKPIDSISLEATYENQLEGMSWAERIDALEQLEEMEARHPGRALELHQKLSSPSRRRTLPETLRCFQAKQAQAKEKRDRLMHEKAQKLRELLNKVEEVKAAQAQLIEDKRVRLEMKLKRAEVNRKLHLKGIIRKAHDEEEKLKEIAFINELEAQNKRHDFMALCQEQEERLQGIQEERQRKQEEKAAKEAAVEERRRVLEAERQERLEKMQELRRKREERVGKKQQEREKERQELAREKARDREERLSALHAAQLATQEELQKKIQQKQEESARRHEENIEHIRQRALESSILRCSTDDVAPRLAPYDTQKLCEVCNVLIGSEVYLLSHLRGRKHQEAVQNQLEGQDPSREELASYNVRHIVDAPADKIDPKIALDKERQKALKKRCKKIRLRMAARGQEYEAKREVPSKIDSPNKTRIQKCLRDIDKLQSSQGKGQWPNNAITSLERAVGEINRILDKKNPQDQAAFQALNGFTTLSNIMSLSLDVPVNMAPYLPPKCFVTSCTCYNYACRENAANSKYVLFSNKVSMILDLLLHRLSVLIPDRNRLMTGSSSVGQTALPVDAVAGGLMRLLALILNHAVPESPENEINPKDELGIRIQDVISYTVSVGIVDKLALYCGGVRDPIDGDPPAGQFLLSGLELLTTLAARCGDLRRGSSTDDPTQLVATLQVTELVGAVSMLYGMLLHQGAPPRDSVSAPPALPPHTIAVTIATIRLLSRVAELDLQMFQSVLGAEGISLQFRHIASYLLWYCSQDKEKDLLHEVVRVVGFFTVRNHDNQMMIQSGYMPTVLQQLCNLPFPYFSNPRLSSLLFPTLLACCSDNPQNRAILEQEVSYQLLEDFRNSEVGKSNRLVSLLNASSAA